MELGHITRNGGSGFAFALLGVMLFKMVPISDKVQTMKLQISYNPSTISLKICTAS